MNPANGRALGCPSFFAIGRLISELCDRVYRKRPARPNFLGLATAATLHWQRGARALTRQFGTQTAAQRNNLGTHDIAATARVAGALGPQLDWLTKTKHSTWVLTELRTQT